MSAQVFKVLICDLVGLAFDKKGKPDPAEVKNDIIQRGCNFHLGPIAPKKNDKAGIHFFYQPSLSTAAEILEQTAHGQFDAVIAAATIIPAKAQFRLGGVRMGAGTGNMQSESWGGGNGLGGVAPLMNTPGFNSRATAQMAMKALLTFRPDLPFSELHKRSVAGKFDTGRDLWHFPTAKLEGQTLGIMGFGNIGRELAKLGSAFGMKIKVYARDHHRARIEAEGYHFAPTIVEAAKAADVLSVHTGLGPLDPKTKTYANAHIIGAAALKVMNKGATLINFDRGECVDAKALQAAMLKGQIAHAAIDADVFVTAKKISGPMLPYLPLAKAFPGRILLLPHAAADTDHPSRVAAAKQAVGQIIDCIKHRRVTNLKGDLPPGYEVTPRIGV